MCWCVIFFNFLRCVGNVCCDTFAYTVSVTLCCLVDFKTSADNRFNAYFSNCWHTEEVFLDSRLVSLCNKDFSLCYSVHCSSNYYYFSTVCSCVYGYAWVYACYVVCCFFFWTCDSDTWHRCSTKWFIPTYVDLNCVDCSCCRLVILRVYWCYFDLTLN